MAVQRDAPSPDHREEKRAAAHAARQDMVRRALREGGARAEHVEAGMVRGVHYLELVEPIKAAKRAGRLQEAWEMALAAVQGAENDPHFPVPPPWYTEQAAIIARKLGRRDDEVAVLERYLAHLDPAARAGHPLTKRLQAARRR